MNVEEAVKVLVAAGYACEVKDGGCTISLPIALATRFQRVERIERELEDVNGFAPARLQQLEQADRDQKQELTEKRHPMSRLASLEQSAGLPELTNPSPDDTAERLRRLEQAAGLPERS